MRKLIFQELIIVSDLEKSAEIFQFGPKKNLILGQKNKVGKTSLCTSLLWALGCKPRFPPRWGKLGIKTLITFDIDGVKYSIKRTKDNISIHYDNKTEIFEKVSGGFSEKLSNILNCEIYLKPSTSKDFYPAIPSALFLSSFIHSDTGWGEVYKSFDDLMMYSVHERRYLTEYFVGIRGDEFFKPRKERSKLNSLIEKSETKSAQYKIVQTSIKDLFYMGNDSSSEDKVDFLLEERSFHIANLMEAKKEKYDISKQIQIIKKAEQDLFLDYQFATNDIDGRKVTCPTCGVIHENDIVNRFSLLDEREKLKESKHELESYLSSLNQQIKNNKEKVDKISSQILIQEKLDNLPPSLDYIVSDKGANKLLEPIFSELLSVEEKIVSNSKKELDKLPKFSVNKKFKERESKIKNEFALELISNLHEINVFDANVDEILERPYDKIHVSGSDISRMTLAYYKTLNDFKDINCDSAKLPIVIDSPMQQEQDDDNLESVASFIRDWGDNQILLFGRDFEEYESLKNEQGTKVINLVNKRKILSSDNYARLNAALEYL